MSLFVNYFVIFIEIFIIVNVYVGVIYFVSTCGTYFYTCTAVKKGVQVQC